MYTYIFWGCLGAVSIVFHNWFEYNALSTITYKDFLESKHTAFIKNTDENWMKITYIIENQINMEIHAKTESHIKVLIPGNLHGSILTIIKNGATIKIAIKRKVFSFLPDATRNYVTLQNLMQKLYQ